MTRVKVPGERVAGASCDDPRRFCHAPHRRDSRGTIQPALNA
jgi:hypothetical protein